MRLRGLSTQLVYLLYYLLSELPGRAFEKKGIHVQWRVLYFTYAIPEFYFMAVLTRPCGSYFIILAADGNLTEVFFFNNV